MTTKRHFGAGVLLSIALFALVVPEIATNNPYDQDLMRAAEGPSRDYWLGTDHLGRDIAIRLAVGARHSLVIATSALMLAVIIALTLGVLGGAIRPLGSIVRWMIDVTQSIPGFLIIFLLATTLEYRPASIALAIAVTAWVEPCRVVLLTTEAAIRGPAVEAARLVELPTRSIISTLIMPAVVPSFAAVSGMALGHSILSIAMLGFLGLGLRPPTPEWGTMIAEAMPYIHELPHLVLLPVSAIVATVLGLLLLFGSSRSA